MIVSPEIDAVTLASTWNTRLAPPPLTVTPAAGPVIVSVPVVSLSSSWPPGQGDRLGRGEDGGIEGDDVAGKGVGVQDRLAKAGLAVGVIEVIGGGVDHEKQGRRRSRCRRGS